jgi:hypothetical protein
MKGMPWEVMVGGKIVLIVAILVIAVAIWLKPPNLLNRCGLSVMCIIARDCFKTIAIAEWRLESA